MLSDSFAVCECGQCGCFGGKPREGFFDGLERLFYSRSIFSLAGVFLIGLRFLLGVRDKIIHIVIAFVFRLLMRRGGNKPGAFAYCGAVGVIFRVKAVFDAPVFVGIILLWHKAVTSLSGLASAFLLEIFSRAAPDISFAGFHASFALFAVDKTVLLMYNVM